ncbi:MAG TPA: winged helix DNA-binding domain-containing protein [Thermoanaerobaculia bacterium]|nr:winged helix DNA-binding domain-containing protein [Thermoanaerobaculia bacterium]
MNIARLRLHNQRIAGTTFETPGEVVRWLGAVQAQDYLGALWAVGLRMRCATEGAVERALAERTILRTWPMRGTLHFVAAADARWMLELMTPRVVASQAARHQREYGLDAAIYSKSRDVLTRALEGGKQLSRNAMYQALEDGHVSAAGQHGIHILWRLAQEGLICFGAREGKQKTFVLLDEWVPGAKRLEREEALAELVRRYFTGHGPATVQDLMWWSGLTAADVAAGLEMAKADLVQEVVDDRIYWFSSEQFDSSIPAAYLLPAFDEYVVAYKDRGAVLDSSHVKQTYTVNGIFNPIMILDGQVVGTWKRTLKKASVIVTLNPFNPLKKSQERAFARAGARYGEFLGLPVVME